MRVAWQNDESFSDWTLGKVIDDLGDLWKAVDGAGDGDAAYATAQRIGFAATFGTSTCASSDVAASAIAKLLRDGSGLRRRRVPSLFPPSCDRG